MTTAAGMPTITSTLAWARNYLQLHAVPNPELDARLLLSHVVGCDSAELQSGDPYFDHNLLLEYYRLIALRGTRYPLQYSLGSVNFMGFDFIVQPGVFIPRPETEVLVETVVTTVNEGRGSAERSGASPKGTRGCGARRSLPGGDEGRRGELKILDLCTGCGNIAISLTKLLKAAKIIASDISETACAVAKENRKRHKCTNVAVVKSNLFRSLYVKGFDIIVSNPPYVAEEDFQQLVPELTYEPREALDGGERGLSYYERILDEAPSFLKKGGYLILEIGDDQAAFLEGMFDKRQYMLREIVKDYNRRNRVMVLQRHDG